MAASAEEIERVYLERYAPFRRAVAAIVGSEERAHDAVQEGFARALAKRRQFRGGSLEAWIWRIVVRQALDLRERPAPALEDGLNAELLVSDRDPQLAAAIRRLPPRRRLIVFLRYFGDLSHQQIGELTGLSAGTVGAALAVPRIAFATGHWNLFSLTATDEEVPLPEGEAKLGYVVGNEVRLPGRRPSKLAGSVGAYVGSQHPLVVPSADGRTLVYHTWVRELDRRRGALKSATNFLRSFDAETGRDELLERGAAAAAWRRDGALAYLRPTVPEFRNNRRGWRGA